MQFEFPWLLLPLASRIFITPEVEHTYNEIVSMVAGENPRDYHFEAFFEAVISIICSTPDSLFRARWLGSWNRTAKPCRPRHCGEPRTHLSLRVSLSLAI